MTLAGPAGRFANLKALLMPLGIVILTVSPSDLPCAQNWLRRMTPSIVSKPVGAMCRLLVNVFQLVFCFPTAYPGGSALPTKGEGTSIVRLRTLGALI